MTDTLPAELVERFDAATDECRSACLDGIRACRKAIEALTPPFAPGDLVLRRANPYRAMTVVSCRPYDDGKGWLVKTMRGGIEESGSSDKLIAAPPDWQDAPELPSGTAAYGLSYADWQAKLTTDAADPEYQHAMADWYAARREWAVLHLARVDTDLAEMEIRDADAALADENREAA